MINNRLFVIEGPDGVGKTTVCAEVAAIWKQMSQTGIPLPELVTLREPGSTAAGSQIRSVLMGEYPKAPMTELLLFLAARAELQSEITRLSDTHVILIDRYTLSTIAYQVFGRRLPLQRILSLLDTLSFQEPVCYFVLDAQDEILDQRIFKRMLSDRLRDSYAPHIHNWLCEYAKSGGVFEPDLLNPNWVYSGLSYEEQADRHHDIVDLLLGLPHSIDTVTDSHSYAQTVMRWLLWTWRLSVADDIPSTSAIPENSDWPSSWAEFHMPSWLVDAVVPVDGFETRGFQSRVRNAYRCMDSLLPDQHTLALVDTSNATAYQVAQAISRSMLNQVNGGHVG